MRSGVGWGCSFYSFYGLPAESQLPLPHSSIHPHILRLYLNPATSPHSLPTSPIVICARSLQGLTMNQMKKLSGRKASLPRCLAAHPPSLGMAPQTRARLGSARVGRGFPAEGRPQQLECQSAPI